MHTDTQPIRVWDLPTRVFHWSLVASFAIAFVTADSEKLRDIHVIAGYTLAGLLVFRLLWGFVGGSYARFAEFLPTPQKLIDYIKSLINGQPQHYVGHNPAGAVAIFLLLGFGMVAAASGWATYENVGGQFMEELHEGASNGMMAIVVIHIAGVIVSSWLHHENLVLAMITGWKKLRNPTHEILLVEDDALLGDALQVGLRQADHVVDWVRDGISAETALIAEDYAAVVLDLGLPRLDGLEVLRHLRAKKKILPVLILTARDTVEDRIRGLDAGADDYLVKPFDLGELTARLRALLRRAGGQPSPVLAAAGITLDPATRRVECKGQDVELSAKEYALLHALMQQPGRALSRAQLEQHLYAWGDEIGSNAVEVYIHHLRRKLGTDVIRTLRGIGYVVARSGNES